MSVDTPRTISEYMESIEAHLGTNSFGAALCIADGHAQISFVLCEPQPRLFGRATKLNERALHWWSHFLDASTSRAPLHRERLDTIRATAVIASRRSLWATTKSLQKLEQKNEHRGAWRTEQMMLHEWRTK